MANDYQKARRNDLYATLQQGNLFWACVDLDGALDCCSNQGEDAAATTLCQRIAIKVMDKPGVDLIGVEGDDRDFEMHLADGPWARQNLRHRRVALLIKAGDVTGKVIVQQTWNKKERHRSSAHVVGVQADSKSDSVALRKALGWRK